MLPDPLHPAIVHFPIVLMVILPISAIVAMWAIGRGTRVASAWLVPLAFAVALSASALVAKETGEDQAHAVRDRVPREFVHTHSESADLFFALSVVVLAITVAGFAKGRVGAPARTVATIAAFGLVAAGYRVGHSGGELVYKHGAAGAAARTDGAPTVGVTPGRTIP